MTEPCDHDWHQPNAYMLPYAWSCRRCPVAVYHHQAWVVSYDEVWVKGAYTTREAAGLAPFVNPSILADKFVPGTPLGLAEVREMLDR